MNKRNHSSTPTKQQTSPPSTPSPQQQQQQQTPTTTTTDLGASSTGWLMWLTLIPFGMRFLDLFDVKNDLVDLLSQQSQLEVVFQLIEKQWSLSRNGTALISLFLLEIFLFLGISTIVLVSLRMIAFASVENSHSRLWLQRMTSWLCIVMYIYGHAIHMVSRCMVLFAVGLDFVHLIDHMAHLIMYGSIFCLIGTITNVNSVQPARKRILFLFPSWLIVIACGGAFGWGFGTLFLHRKIVELTLFSFFFILLCFLSNLRRSPFTYFALFCLIGLSASVFHHRLVWREQVLKHLYFDNNEQFQFSPQQQYAHDLLQHYNDLFAQMFSSFSNSEQLKSVTESVSHFSQYVVSSLEKYHLYLQTLVEQNKQQQHQH